MGHGNSTHFDAVEQWSPTLFLVGGGLVITHATVQAIDAFTAMTTPPDVFVAAGHLVALVGLLVLYPVPAYRTPRLARVAGPAAPAHGSNGGDQASSPLQSHPGRECGSAGVRATA
jgi:hypothetical protein